MTPHPYGSCHFEDCPACERIAEAQRDEYDPDPYGWLADEAAEREADGGWRWVS